MQPPAFSLIIVSRHRPDWLRRCLKAVGQLDYPRFETIVVACPKGEEVAKAVPGTQVIGFDVANISAARNAGADAASGDIIAFLDDDSVPEPTWLAHLALAFADPEVVQAGGITLGRNGISVQHGAALVDDTGRSHPLHMALSESVVVHPKDHCHPRLHGTNMALRRAALLEHGGFDTRFAFYLDETDLSYRISRAGGQNRLSTQSRGASLKRSKSVQTGGQDTAGRFRNCRLGRGLSPYAQPDVQTQCSAGRVPV
jgi:GT2 family glycosyltransferase